MKKRYIVYVLLLAGFAYLIVHRIAANKKIAGNNTSKGAKNGGGKPVATDGVVIQTENFTGKLELSGSLEANEAVVLRSEISGLVTDINFKEGHLVSKGQLLVKINDRDVQAQLRQAQTKQDLSAVTENRAKQLLAKGAISQEEYDMALADWQTLKSQTQLVKAQLAKTAIIAPFSGRVGLRQISVGEYVTPATAIANLSNTNPIKLTFSIPERYAGTVKTGTRLTFKTDGSNKDFEATVYAVEPGIDMQTRTWRLRALAQNPKNELLPGTFATISLPTNTIANAILIPSEAIVPVLTGKSVFLAKNGKAEQINIETGTRTANRVVVTKGIDVGDTVLTTGLLAVRPGTPVKVKLAKAR